MMLCFTNDEIKDCSERFFKEIECWDNWVTDENKPFGDYKTVSDDDDADFLIELTDTDGGEDIALTAVQKKIVYDTYLKYANEYIKKIHNASELRDEIDEVLSKYGYETSDEINLDDGVIYIERN